MFAFLLSIIFLVVIAADALQNSVTTNHPNGLIFGSNSIQINEAPYHVSIFNNDKLKCVGVILSKDYVLTAAHCGLSSVGDFELYTGSSLPNRNEGRTHTVVQYREYESDGIGSVNWDVNRYSVMANDIVLVKIDPPIQFDATRQPITMFDEAEDVGENVEALITGWTNVNGSEHLSTRHVDIIPSTSCEDVYKNVGGVPAGQICASYPGAKGKTGCVGVSGGPLVVDGRLAGILSWGNGCVKRNGPGVYTEIAYYRRWIDQAMEENDTFGRHPIDK